MMSPNRTLPWLVAGVLSLAALAPAWGQTYPNDPQVFPPGDIQDGQLFARSDPSSYGGQLHPGGHEGFFFNLDLLVWSIQKPNPTSIGVANSQRPVWVTTDANLDFQNSELSTGELKSVFSEGERFEFGYSGDSHGWMCDIFRLGGKKQSIEASFVDMVFLDPVVGNYGESRLQGLVTHVAGVPDYPGQPNPPYIIPGQRLRNLPITFRNMYIDTRTDAWDVELLYTRRFRQLHSGGNVELYFGARYMEFNEQFDVLGLGGVLDDSFWNTEARNQIVGPEVGGRWWRQTGRWKMSVDGRFTAGLNSQNIRQEGMIGSKLNPPGVTVTPPSIYSMGPSGFSSVASERVFSPIVEIRAELGYQVTRAIVFKAGWNAIWVDGLARPSSMINYTMPPDNGGMMGILTQNNKQDALLTGVTIGFEVNR